MSKEHIITVEFDLDNPPPLTPEQLEEIRKLKEMPDSEIDYSDIPPLDFSKVKFISRDESPIERAKRKHAAHALAKD